MRKVTKVTNGVLIESDDEYFTDFIVKLAEIEDVTTPKELTEWYDSVQELVQEYAIDGFKTLVRTNVYGRKNRFDEALIVLQGGQ